MTLTKNKIALLTVTMAAAVVAYPNAFAQAPGVISEADMEREEIVAEVVIEFTIGEEGVPEKLTVISSTDPEMNETAISTVSKWKLNPEMKGKKARVPIAYSQGAVDKAKAAKKDPGGKS